MLKVRGAREHNLQGVDVTIPRGSLTTITGVSGSGKSSLAFDTIYREGQRRFLESLSSYARQFLGGIERPRVEQVEGLSPAVSIDQKTVSRNPRSTVGTITEIYDHLRLLFARLGTPGCPECGRAVTAQSAQQIVDRILRDFGGQRAIVLAPWIRDRKGEYRKELNQLLRDGFVRARIDGEIQTLSEDMRLERYKRHTIEVVIDRVVVKESARSRIAEAVERGLDRGQGFLNLLVGEEVHSFSRFLHCVDCGIDLPELEPRLFSFNSPRGACPACDGLGVRRTVDPRKVVVAPEKSIREGALAVVTSGGSITYARIRVDELSALVPVDKPWKRLTERQRSLVLYGNGKAGGMRVRRSRTWKGKSYEVSMADSIRFGGVMPALERALHERNAKVVQKFVSDVRCPDCAGQRLRPEALAVTFRTRSIADAAGMTVQDALAFFETLELGGNEELVGREILKELRARLGFLEEVGLGYLNLDRSAATLAGGEAQRIRLATQVGAALKGVLYVLDEPSIGLHPRDNDRLLKSLKRLRDAGNTVLVVEHDDATMRASDYLVDVGPGAGRHGGEIVSAGTPAEVWRSDSSLTARYLRGDVRIPVPEQRRTAKDVLTVRGARHHNLKSIDVAFPLGVLTCVTGVSGSGKSTLVNDILRRTLARDLHGAERVPGEHDGIDGIDGIDKVIEIDQAPIGRTPRSNAATYTKLFDSIRDLFAMLKESRARGYPKGRFSFNVKGGRCEHCKGAGLRTVEMQFLPDVEIPCEICGGKRFNEETLEILFKGRSISDVLEMTIEEACGFFQDHPKIARVLQTLHDVGLGYLSLGQPATTLSGGEAQRVKIAKELGRPGTGRTLYILDEPTTGLHHEDVRRLLESLERFVERGNTVLVVEHNLDVIKRADHLVDLGPEGGEGGGQVVCAGTPEEIAAHPTSHTGKALRPVLRPRRPRAPATRKAAPQKRKTRALRVRGATLHNLKSVSVTVPADAITVVTGPSGSGKTSLAFDTIFAEGQRRYVESLSTYARRFLGRMDKPPVESVEGLGPAIAIDQRNRSRNPRSTVATTTEIHDYLRLLYARAGTPRCPVCRTKLVSRSPSQEAGRILREQEGKRLLVLTPLRRAELREVAERDLPPLLDKLRRDGFTRLLVDGRPREIAKAGEIPPAAAVDLIVDRVQVRKGQKARIAEALALAYRIGHGLAGVAEPSGAPRFFTERPGCAEHGVLLPQDELQPRMFSFNSHHGACGHCHGLGTVQNVDPERVIRYPGRRLKNGAFGRGAAHYIVDSKWYWAQVEVVAKANDLPLDLPMKKWGKKHLSILFDGTGDRVYKINKRVRRRRGRSFQLKTETKWLGVSKIMEGWYRKSGGGGWTDRITEVMRPSPCPECAGERLGGLSRSVTLGRSTRLPDLLRSGVDEARRFFEELRLPAAAAELCADVLKEIRARIAFLSEVGLGYLTLDRSTATLAGGEAQRIRLATQIGSGLVGVIYVLDEPTVGLHPRDTERLLATLRDLKALGNTVLLVEHDTETIRAADHVIDLGPGAGRRGGEVVFEGGLGALLKRRGLPTADFVSGRRTIPRPPERPKPDRFLKLRNVRKHNIAGLNVALPLERLCCITGVSGSGKSTLLLDVLWQEAQRALEGRSSILKGADELETIYVVDQLPIGVTPASNPATYTKVFGPIRKLFAQVPEARMRGYDAGRFSFNRPGGRCEHCEGRGALRVEMHFLADVWVPCEVCRGARYNRETLQVRWKGKSIADVLEMEVAEALAFFQDIPSIRRILAVLDEIGLGYLGLGQPATTLSGGEAQRVKLASELVRGGKGGTLYLLDEPTTGLHPTDVEKLVGVLHRLVDAGNSVLVVEHNVDLIRSADWILDLGPEGGAGGGRIVAEGPPETVARSRGSHTARFLTKS